MKFISWNVNGLRACLKKGFEDTFNALDADFFCVQETKMQPGQADFAPAGYTEYIYSAEKKGYSGTAIWAKTPALSVNYGIDCEAHSHEGRAITLEYPDFYLVNLYVPNAQNELARIDYRMQREDDFRAYLIELDKKKPVVLCGRLIKNSSLPGQTVLDLFGGSGSTLIACEQLSRKCYTMEYDPRYVDVIVQRWEDFTGEKAVRLK